MSSQPIDIVGVLWPPLVAGGDLSAKEFPYRVFCGELLVAVLWLQQPSVSLSLP